MCCDTIAVIAKLAGGKHEKRQFHIGGLLCGCDVELSQLRLALVERKPGLRMLINMWEHLLAPIATTNLNASKHVLDL